MASVLATLTLCGIAVVITLLTGLSGGCTPALALGKGVIDYRLEAPAEVDLSTVPDMVTEIGPARLNARWTRVMVRWKMLQPLPPGTWYPGDANADGYADSYVQELNTIVGLFRASGVKVILTPLDVPEWASNVSLWNSPPRGYEKGYQPFYAMDVADPVVLPAFGRMGEFLAANFRGSVRHFEVWNEPNLGLYLYPQNLPGAYRVGARTYLKMLGVFSHGVHRGASDAIVIAGATSPSGFNNDSGTSPQSFARFLRDRGAARYFDAYSHHPYGSRNDRRVAPSERPNAPYWEVTLYNLDVLLKLFPGKDFYLTEYGYNSRRGQLFGPAVSAADQARYLRQAYSLVARRYPRVRAMLWFVVQDMAPDVPGGLGCYMGLRTANGVRKPSWYAFAGGTSVALKAPPSARASEVFTVSGLLANRALGPVAGARVQLEARWPGVRTWRVLSAQRTRVDGSCAFRVRQTFSRSYRIVWDGVLGSVARKVATPVRQGEIY